MPKKRNEATSKRVASIAGKVLRCLKDCHGTWPIWIPDYEGHGFTEKISVRELRALAASALTQREDRVGYGESIRVGPPLELHKIRTKSHAEKAAIKKTIASAMRPKPKRNPARKGRK